MKQFRYFVLFCLYFFILNSPALAAKKIIVLPFEVMSLRDELQETGDFAAFNLADSLSMAGISETVQENQVPAIMERLGLKAADFSDTKNITRVGKYLEADIAVSGVVEVNGSNYKVTGKLTEVNSGKQLKSFSLQDKELSRVFGNISLNTINALNIKLNDTQKKAIGTINRPFKSLSAAENYVKGRKSFYRFSFASLKQANGYFEKALEADNAFLQAKVWQAKTAAVTGLLLSRNNEEFRGHTVPAGENAAKLIQGTAYSLEAYKALAFVNLAEGNVLQAHNSIKPVMAKSPADAEANLAAWLINREDPDSELLKKTLTLNPFSVLSNLLAGRAYQNKGQYEAALASYEKAIALEPENEVVLTYLGDLYMLQGKADKAAEKYTEAGNSWFPLTRLAEYHLNVNNPQKAEEYYKKAAVLKPDSAAINFQLAVLYYNQGLLAEAREHFGRVLKAKPEQAQAYYHLGLINQSEGKYREALQDYDKALALNAGIADVHYNKGIILAQLGQNEDAVNEYKKAFLLRPNFAEAYYNLAIIYKKLGKTEEAAAEYQEALKIRPDFTEAYINLGSIYFEQNDLEAAEKNYLAAIKTREGYARAHNNLGAVYQKQGRTEEAIREFREAIRFNPGYGNAYANLAAVYTQQGKKKEAAENTKKACDNGYLPACN